MTKLVIKNLKASVNGIEILKGINLEMDLNEIHALLGPNGHGKSTLLGVLMGNPKYEVTEGSITWDGEDLLAMSVDERSRKGLFLAMQYPQEIPGVTVSDFMKAAINAHQDKPVSLYKFIKSLENAAKDVNLPLDMVHRFINEGFSGGEKKRNEIFQMAMLEPKLSILDETDSGLDIDALRIVAGGVNKLKSSENASIVITHYQRLLDYIVPDFVHVLYKGKIVKSAGKELALELEEKGYDWIKKELGE